MIEALKVLGHALFRLLFSVEYHGLENVPIEGPVIIAGNHPSYLDPVLIGIPVKRLLRFMAWDALFKVPGLGFVIRSLGAFPVDIGRGKGEMAYREAVKVLEAGHALVIFPEGQRSEKGPMGELRTGVARLAIDTGAPIVPVTVGGAFRAWPKWKLLPKPAKIAVRFHEPIQLNNKDREGRGLDREFHHQVMERVKDSINRSLGPALREGAMLERWYRQPPSPVRSYEWAPLIAAAIAGIVALGRGASATGWIAIVLFPVVYYCYLAADLSLIKPSRSSKWLRNSMPIWLVLAWHYPLTAAIRVPSGALNALLVTTALAAFFAFFWEDYYTLQKFVRGVITAYYFSLALQLILPDELGTLTTLLVLIATFSVYFRTLYYPATALVMMAALGFGFWAAGTGSWRVIAYALLGVADLIYLQTFVSAAYDIRKAGIVSTTRTSGQDQQ